MIRHKNWMSYSYDGIAYGKKTNIDSLFTLNFKPIDCEKLSYQQALYRNAEIIKDCYKGPFDICFSGGTDSEVVLRVYKDLGIKFNTYIFKFEDEHNILDVNNAINTCKKLNIDYNIIDFNLKHFFENDAYFYADQTKCAIPERLPRLKWIEMLDNIPIFGDGEPHWSRIKWDNFNEKSEWGFHFSEDACIGSVYSKQINKIAITEWYEFTPEINLAFYNLPYVRNLLDDRVTGKLSSWSSRAKIHQEFWPDIQYVPKLVGYENKQRKPGEIPDFMADFKNIVLKEFSNANHIISEREFLKCLTDYQKL